MDGRGTREPSLRARQPGPGRAGKLVPPRDPTGTLDRPLLEARLLDATQRRLTLLVAGAGYGKSTLAARTARAGDAAWYAVDAGDAHLGSFASGVVAALRSHLPALPEDLATPIATAIDPKDDAEALARGQAAATLVADALQEALHGELLLVLDDCQEVDGAPGSWRFVEALVRLAPEGLHILLASRSDPPFGVERLRAQGEVTDLGGRALVFSVEEIEAIVQAQLPATVVPREHTPDAARRIESATGGWPAAVRLTLEALRAAPPGGREAVLDRLQRPEGPLFAYLAQEVLASMSDVLRDTMAAAALFDRFSAPMLPSHGLPDLASDLEAFARRGLFLQPLPGDPGWYVLHGLVREYARSSFPLPRERASAIRLAAAEWLEAQCRTEAALAELVAAGDPGCLATFLDRHAPALVLAGVTRQVTDAAALLTPEARTSRVEQACGEAYMVRGDWRAATASFTRSARGGPGLDARTAWRLGLVHGLRGAYDEALAVYARARIDGDDPVEEAMLYAWIASAHYHRGELDASGAAARTALELAQRTGDARALSAAHTAIGMAAELEHDFHRASQALDRAVELAVLAGDTLQEVRIRNARGALELDLGNVEAAFRTLDEAVRLADAVGFASFHARALVNRGRAHQSLGRFEEALADYSTARQIYNRVGSPSVAYPLVREGYLHQLRGDLVFARFAFEGAVNAARGASDAESLAPALAGLAQVLALEEPARARDLAEEAVELGRRISPLAVLLGAARTSLALGDRDATRRYAREATNIAAARQDQPGYAAGLELQALVAGSTGEATHLCERAARVWTTAGIPYGYARNRLILAGILDGDPARRAAEDAASVFRSIGARGPAAEAAERLETLDRARRPALEIRALGRFRVSRDGEPVATTAWQSKKARDLLKILVARRGRPTTRETLFELLWPDEDPEPLANRLSVALATARAVLDPDKRFPADWFIGGDKQAVWLDASHIEIDVEAFLARAGEGLRLVREERAGDAMGLLAEAEAGYGGTFLEEDPYEDWAVGLREDAQAAYIAVTRVLAEAAAGYGNADDATRYFLRILEHDGYDEAAHLGLVRALRSAGRHGEARRRYGVYADRMAEMGVEAAPFPAPRGRLRR